MESELGEHRKRNYERLTDSHGYVKKVKHILDTTNVKGGLIVHLGCGDGKLTAALRINDSYTVHGLGADPAKVAQARSYIKEKGIYGPVSVEQYSGSVLPYTDNLINLVVVQKAGGREQVRAVGPLRGRGRPGGWPRRCFGW